MKTSTCTTSAAPLSGTMKPATLQKKKRLWNSCSWLTGSAYCQNVSPTFSFLFQISGWMCQTGKHKWGCCQWDGLMVRAKVLAGESHFFQKEEIGVGFQPSLCAKRKKKERKRRRWRLRWNSLLGSERRLLPTNGSVSGFEKVIWRGREKRGCTYADQGADQWVTPAFLASWRYWKRPLFHKITSQIMPQRPEREPERDSSGKDRFQHPEGDVYKVCFCEFSFRLKACVWCFFFFNSRGKK